MSKLIHLAHAKQVKPTSDDLLATRVRFAASLCSLSLRPFGLSDPIFTKGDLS